MTLFELASQRMELKKAGTKQVGPCPKCGGNTRFVVNVAKDFGHCYSCGFNADAIRWLREVEGLSCPEAHREAGQECDRPECPAWDKCSRGKGERKRRDERGTPAVRERQRHRSAPTAAESPAQAWQRQAMEMVDRCHERLLACPEQLDYLAGRGLPLGAVEKYRLGWIPELEFKSRLSWGLEKKWHQEEKRWVSALPFFQGILIPWIIDGHVHRLRIRKAAVTGPKDPRYIWVDGSGNDIICLNHKAKAHCVVESDLDGLLIDWVAGDLVGAVPLGSCSTHPKETVWKLLQESLRIMVALDFDGELRDGKVHAPGGFASLWWFEHFPASARRWPTPQGKDPGDAYKAGADLRTWVIAGLPPAMRLAAMPKAPPLPTITEQPLVPSPTEEAKVMHSIPAAPQVTGAGCGECKYMGWQKLKKVCRHPHHPSLIEKWPHKCGSWVDQDKKIMPGHEQTWLDPLELWP